MNVIVAVYSDWGIGCNGSQPIVLPEDRRHFRQLTDGGTVIVGRKTLEDFPSGKPLPKRKNIILTKNAELSINGAVTVNSTDELLSEIAGDNPEKIFVIGGGSIYNLLLTFCHYAYVTKINTAPPSDTFFPNLDRLDNWELSKSGTPMESSGISYSFAVYKNNAPQIRLETAHV